MTEEQRYAPERAIKLVEKFKPIIAHGKRALELAARDSGFTILIRPRDGTAVTATSPDLGALFGAVEQALEDYQASPLGKVN